MSVFCECRVLPANSLRRPDPSSRGVPPSVCVWFSATTTTTTTTTRTQYEWSHYVTKNTLPTELNCYNRRHILLTRAAGMYQL
jgi:hypothetical protein